MKCYHMTTLDRLESINRLGLIPGNGNNCKLVNDDKFKVFFSEGFEGSIALFVDFYIVYNKIKNSELKISDISVYNKVINSKSLEEFLGDGVYLTFEMLDIINERNFENGCTSTTIEPNKLSVLVLRKLDDNIVTYSRFKIINYMMSRINPNDIKYYGMKYPNSPTFKEATIRIQTKVKDYYEKNNKIIQKYKNEKYELIEIPLDIFIKDYL